MKHILLITLIIINSILIFLFSSNGLSEIESQMKWVEDGRAGINVNYFKDYTKEQIKNLKIELHSEKNKLQNIQTIVKWTMLLTSLYALGLLIKYPVKKNMGITILLFAIILIVSINSVIDLFRSFDKFQNIDLELNTLIILIFISPILFRMAYKTNQREIEIGLHNNKWISIVSLILFVASVLFALGTIFLLLLASGSPDGYNIN